SLDLLALGAPSDLVVLAHRAALDEIVHARLAFGLAGAPERAERGPGAMSMPALGPPSLERLALEPLFDGCIGEPTAAVLAREAASRCEPGALRNALETIAEDEARHAELAWRILAWAVSSGGAGLSQRLLEAWGSYRAGDVD